MAVACAVCWAVAVVLFKRVEGVRPMAINLFKNVQASVLLLATMAALGVGFDWTRPLTDWRDLIISGLIGIAVADTFYLEALRRLGASAVAVIECAYAPTIVALAVLFLREPVTLVFVLGTALVVCGLMVAVWPSRHRETLPVAGLLLGFSAMALMAVGVTLAKGPLDRGDLVEVTVIRLLAGVAGQTVWILALPGTREIFGVLRPSRAWRRLIPAGLFATYISMLLWLGGLKYTSVSVASVLNQLSVAFTLILAWLWLREPISRRRWIGAGLSLAGALLVIAGGRPVADGAKKALSSPPQVTEPR